MKITEKQQKDVYLTSYVKKPYMVLKKFISNHAEQLLTRYTSLKNQVTVPEKGLSQQITEKWQNDNYKCVIRQKRDMI